MYFINKQMLPGNNLIWVLKLNESDKVYSFDSLEEAEIKKDELMSSDSTGRIYKISIKNEDESFSDI